jgi:hypothetical protein
MYSTIDSGNGSVQERRIKLYPDLLESGVQLADHWQNETGKKNSRLTPNLKSRAIERGGPFFETRTRSQNGEPRVKQSRIE